MLSQGPVLLPKDPAKAAQHYEKAADKGNALAMHNLGRLLESGRGVPKDVTTALKWHRASARAGNAKAQAHLKKLGESW